MSSQTVSDPVDETPVRLTLILLLAAVTAIGPFAMHALAPALPFVAADFQVPAALAQLMLSLSLVAMAVFNLIWGPLSDRYGRRPMLLTGLALGAAGSVVAAVAPDIWTAVLGRLMQANEGVSMVPVASGFSIAIDHDNLGICFFQQSINKSHSHGSTSNYQIIRFEGSHCVVCFIE